MASTKPPPLGIDLAILGMAADPLVWSKLSRRRRQGWPAEPGDRRLLVADREALAALCAPAPEHEAPVLRAHPDQKSVRPAPASAVRLKRPFSLHLPLVPRNRTRNVSEGVQNVSIVALCVRVSLLHPALKHEFPDVRSGSSQSFPHLWKNLWKLHEIRDSAQVGPGITAVLGGRQA